ILFTSIACKKEKTNVVPPTGQLPITNVPDSSDVTPFLYAQYANNLSKSWTWGRRYHYTYRTGYDTATRQDIYTTIDTMYTDTTVAINKVNDTTVSFKGKNYAFSSFDSVQNIISYLYDPSLDPSFIVIRYYYNADSVYVESRSWKGPANGFATYWHYSK